jgi:hypothetical protein
LKGNLNSGNKEDLRNSMELIIRLVEAKKENSAEMEYRHLPENIQKVFRGWDADGSGRVDASELNAAAQAWDKLQKESTLMKRLLFATVVVIILMFAGMFAMGMITAELAKEFKSGGSSGDPTMVSKDGTTIQVASTDSSVDDSGMMKSRRTSTSGRRLGDGSDAVATTTAKVKKLLHSSLPNSYFEALDEITVHSEKGHTLGLKIFGFARVPALNSRCGNLLKMFTAVDGHLSLDSYDLSFSGHLETLFKNAGFEVAVGGASGRRLKGASNVDGFFNHVKKMKAEGSWKCGSVPLPKMTEYTVQKFTSYRPCSAPVGEGNVKVEKDSCESNYGGVIAGVEKIPEAHHHATLSNLDRVRKSLGQLKDTSKVLYLKTNDVVMRSPSYQVQRTSFANAPLQEWINVVDKTSRKSVSFQQVTADEDEPVSRNYCKESDQDEPIVKEDNAIKKGDVKMHFEFVGLDGADSGVVYRHFRMMPAKDFLLMMGAEEATKKASTTFEYWDNAADLQPYRLTTPDGTVVVYDSVQDGTTDADVEKFLKGTVNATKFDVQAVKPYKFACDEAESGPGNLDYGKVPQIISGDTDVGPADLDFYVRLLYDAASSGSESADGVHEEDARAVTVAEEGGGGDKEALMSPAWARLNLIPKGDTYYGFAQYALRSKELFAMPDVCAASCNADVTTVKEYVKANGEEQLCGAPGLTPLRECLLGLSTSLKALCGQSPFFTRLEVNCTTSRRLQASEAEVHTMSDGTKSMDLSTLDSEARAHLQGALAEVYHDSHLGDLQGAHLLFNKSKSDNTASDVVVSRKGAASRRLMITSCTSYTGGGVCIGIALPKPGQSPYWCWRDSVDGPPVTRCTFTLKIAFEPSKRWNRGQLWALEVTVAGSVEILQTLFGIPNPPVKGAVNGAGGIRYSATPACPNIPFSLHGWVQIGVSWGINLWICTVDLFNLSLKVGIKFIKVPA